MRTLYPILSLTLLGGALLTACSPAPEFQQTEWSPGGDLTAKRLSDRTFIEPGPSVSRPDQLTFWTGFSLFRDPWVIAPSSTTDRDGLGPLFNTRSCISCHLGGARGPLPELGLSKPSALVVRLGVMDLPEYANKGLDPIYGDQIQSRAIAIGHASLKQKVAPEAKLDLRYEIVQGEYADGTPYELKKPIYQLRDLAYGDIAEHVGLSPRFAPILYGAGLLDAIAESDLLAQEDEYDKDGDGISARYNRVQDLVSNERKVGRFGLKAKHPTLHQQVAAAFRDDIGITNSLFPQESCSASQSDCQQASLLGGHVDEKGQQVPEIPDKLLALVSQFNHLLAVPPARKLASEMVQQGRELFYRAECDSCHTPSYTTDEDYPIAVLAKQTIWPYTDLALHDMGSELADGIKEASAGGNEWRTPPLWGLGWQLKISRQPAFLHDGRATSIEEAILWHAGEAENSRQEFIHFDQSERDALIAFLNAI